MNNRKVPGWLKRCERCGEWHGFVREGDLTDNGPYFCTGNPERRVEINCICAGPLCRKCRKNRLHRPISHFWDEQEGRAIHVPWCVGFSLLCEECRPDSTEQPDYSI
jgi:hypothetical protein